jgi:hypothetical protein
MTPNNENESKPKSWKQKLFHEFVEYWINFAFLAFFFIAFAWYRRLMLASYDIAYTEFWAPLVEAGILAKVIMIGDAMRVGRRFGDRPRAIPTIYRTLMFSVLVVIFSLLEHIVKALFHGKKVSDGIAEFTSQGWQGMLAWYVLIIVAFLPFFTVKEIESAFGPEKVRALFFRKHTEETNSPADGQGEAAKRKP